MDITTKYGNYNNRYPVEFEKYSGEVFNIGGGKDHSFSLLELTEVCSKLTGKKISFSEDNTIRPGDVCWYLTDAAKARSEFDWSPKKSLEETIDDIITWAKNNKNLLKSIL